MAILEDQKFTSVELLTGPNNGTIIWKIFQVRLIGSC